MKWFAVLFLSLLSPLAFAEVAPNFSLRDMNGKQVSLEDYRGQVVLLKVSLFLPYRLMMLEMCLK
jgi:cytochrome oxidase Cu insertion factor (SCO1/SenC/PrrC family)